MIRRFPAVAVVLLAFLLAACPGPPPPQPVYVTVNVCAEIPCNESRNVLILTHEENSHKERPDSWPHQNSGRTFEGCSIYLQGRGSDNCQYHSPSLGRISAKTEIKCHIKTLRKNRNTTVFIGQIIPSQYLPSKKNGGNETRNISRKRNTNIIWEIRKGRVRVASDTIGQTQIRSTPRAADGERITRASLERSACVNGRKTQKRTRLVPRSIMRSGMGESCAPAQTYWVIQTQRPITPIMASRSRLCGFAEGATENFTEGN